MLDIKVIGEGSFSRIVQIKIDNQILIFILAKLARSLLIFNLLSTDYYKRVSPCKAVLFYYI